MKRRGIVAVIGTGLALAAAAATYQWLTDWRWVQDTNDAYLHSDITTVSPQVGGHVASIEVRDNQLVHKGDVLVRIDDRDYRVKVAEAQAQVEARQATLANLDARMELQQANIAAAEAQLASAGAELTRSRGDLARSQELVRQDFVSRQRLDVNQADAAKAGAAVKSAQASLDGARRQLAVLEGERRVDEATLEQARAQLAAAQLELGYTVIAAPVDGLVGNRSVRDGEFVRPGQPLLAVVPVDDVWVEANFKETQLGRMRPGQPVSISVDAFPGVEIIGHVDSFSPASGAKFSLLPPDNATGNFTKVVQRIPVKITVDAGQALAGKLRPGMSAVVAVNTAARGDAGLGAPPKAVATSR